MNETRAGRKLAAILAADVVGYSRLMATDEKGTHARLKALRTSFIEPTIAEHHGRLVKLMGDGILVEFASVVDAVECAIAIQKGVAASQAEVTDDQRIALRIGINIGDIIIEDDDIYGGGVNLAARLEALAEPGGICVSRTVRNHVRDQLPYRFVFLGEQHVKNIPRPVRVFRVVGGATGEPATARRDVWRLIAAGRVALTAALNRKPRFALVILAVLTGSAALLAWQQPWILRVEPAELESMALPLPEKPSIAVVPFKSLSAEAGPDYLAQGIAESIIAALSKIPNLFVIARNSSFAFESELESVHEVAEGMGVRYVLAGSIRRSDERVRVTARLFDALSGRQVWAEQYDQPIDDLFAIQDDITRNVVTAMDVELTEGEHARVWRRQTESPKAYEYFLRGTELFRTFAELENAQAQRLYEQALAIDPDFLIAKVHLGWTYLSEARYGWTDDVDKAWAKVVEIAEEVLEADPSNSDVLTLLGFYHMYGENFDEAARLVREAVALDPNNAINVAALGRLMNATGQPQEAALLIERAMRLSPYYPAWFLRALGNSYALLGDYDKATAALEKCLERNPDISEARATLAYAHAMAGRDEAARATVSVLLARSPDYTLSAYAKAMPNQDTAALARILDRLADLGVPRAAPAQPLTTVR